jgi:hypothetical protein
LVGLLALSTTRHETVGFSRNIHSLDSNGSAILDDDLVDLGVASKVQVRVNSTSSMDVGMGAVAAAAGLQEHMSNLTVIVERERD